MFAATEVRTEVLVTPFEDGTSEDGFTKARVSKDGISEEAGGD